MTWDLDTAKARLGIPDASRDAEIQQHLDIVLQAIEGVLQRRLLRAVDIAETVREIMGRSFMLSRYPVEQIDSIVDPKGSGTVPAYYLDAAAGVVFFDDPVYYDRLEVVYDGGYDPLPADLERAMWGAFDWLWNASEGGEDGLARIPGSGTGEVSRVTIADFGSVTLDSALMGGSGPGMDALVGSQLDWGWLSPWSHTLQPYRSERGAGGGIA